MKRLLSGLLVFALTASVLAEDAAEGQTEEEKFPVADAREAKKEIDSFRRAFDGTMDLDFQLTAVTKLGKVRHDSIVRELLKLMKHEEPFIAAEAMKGLGNQVPFRKKIARFLEKWLVEEDNDPRVVAQTIHTACVLEAKNVEELIILLLFSNEDPVAIGAMNCLAAWRSYKGLPKILELWEMYPDDGEFATGTVTVDTGAAGTKDQAAARARWNAKYGGMAKRGRPELVQAIRKGVNEIVGIEEEEKKLKQFEELKTWMAENKDVLRRHR